MVVNSRHQRENQRVMQFASRWGGILLMLFITSMFGILYYQTIALRIRGEKATATCVRTSSESRSNGRRTTRSYYLHLAYTTQDGESHQAKVDASGTGVSAGQQVEIIYDPQQPSRAQVNQVLQIYGYPIVLTVTMIFLLYYTYRASTCIWKPERS